MLQDSSGWAVTVSLQKPIKAQDTIRAQALAFGIDRKAGREQ
jgi:hypothetical protein